MQWMHEAGTRGTVMADSRVRYLKQWERPATRPMYEAAFPEDSKEFVDYYYKWKTKDNEIIVMEGAKGSGSFHVMIQLNPHTLSINGTIMDIPYIVAVATDLRYRRQGKMRQVMGYALQNMQRKGIPFTFLLPADPAYYRGQGFVDFPCQDYLKTGGICLTEKCRQEMINKPSADVWRHALFDDAAVMAAFANQVLASKCGIYIKRDIYYYHRLLEELRAEHGGVLLSGKGKVQGIIPYSISCTDGEVTAEIREFLSDNDVSKEEAERICREALRGAGREVDKVKFTVSRMMVRLINLSALVSLLQSEKPILYEVKVADSVIEENNGCFRIEIDSGGGNISQIEEKEARQQMDIAELAEGLFQDVSVYLNEWV